MGTASSTEKAPPPRKAPPRRVSKLGVEGEEIPEQVKVVPSAKVIEKINMRGRIFYEVTLTLNRSSSEGLGVGLDEAIEENSETKKTIISELKQGSIAASSGQIHVGDVVLSLNGDRLAGLYIEDARKLLAQYQSQGSVRFGLSSKHPPVLTAQPTKAARKSSTSSVKLPATGEVEEPEAVNVANVKAAFEGKPLPSQKQQQNSHPQPRPASPEKQTQRQSQAVVEAESKQQVQQPEQAVVEQAVVEEAAAEQEQKPDASNSDHVAFGIVVRSSADPSTVLKGTLVQTGTTYRIDWEAATQQADDGIEFGFDKFVPGTNNSVTLSIKNEDNEDGNASFVHVTDSDGNAFYKERIESGLYNAIAFL